MKSAGGRFRLYGALLSGAVPLVAAEHAQKRIFRALPFSTCEQLPLQAVRLFVREAAVSPP